MRRQENVDDEKKKEKGKNSKRGKIRMLMRENGEINCWHSNKGGKGRKKRVNEKEKGEQKKGKEGTRGVERNYWRRKIEREEARGCYTKPKSVATRPNTTQ